MGEGGVTREKQYKPSEVRCRIVMLPDGTPARAHTVRELIRFLTARTVILPPPPARDPHANPRYWKKVQWR